MYKSNYFISHQLWQGKGAGEKELPERGEGMGEKVGEEENEKRDGRGRERSDFVLTHSFLRDTKIETFVFLPIYGVQFGNTLCRVETFIPSRLHMNSGFDSI